MSVPATTGTLKNNIKDMQIGDYIACKYVAASGAVGTFSELGTSTATEIPIASAAVPNGTFYFVKTATGLLIADRNVQSSVSWDVLNAGKYIQGLPWDNGNIIPTMTSNNTPNGVASASSEYGGTNNYYAWKAFDKDNTGLSKWLSVNGTTTGWLSFTHFSPKKITCYTLGKGAGNAGSEPNSWTFEGSNDGNVWTVLDTQIGQINWIDSEKRRYLINNKTEYLKYRINVTKNNGGTYVQIGELEMFEIAGTIRSLTGGVAYADANGNSVTADALKGSWPINNEWDKYIVNFSTNKVQSSKTLDDVFHHVQTLCTWTQDTPMLSKSAATTRVGRGRITGLALTYPASSYSGVDYGFRPVIEYKEV
ncbi:hypothetical protein D3C71_1276880 [compost metagenome]